MTAAPLRAAVSDAARVAVVAFFLHLPWEFAHSVLYYCFPDGGFSKAAYVAMHFRAALGDAGLTVLLLWGGALMAWSPRWWTALTMRRVLLLAGAGALLAATIEYHAVVVAHRWVYADAMPTVFGIGVTPVLQLAFLPLLTFLIARRLRPRAAPA